MQNHLLILLHELELATGWGPATHWPSSYFEELAGRITDQTGFALSATTLKRLWGRVRYTSSPQVSTLDALAQYLDYENWLAFVQAHPTVESAAIVASPSVSAAPAPIATRPALPWWPLPAVLVAGLLIWLGVRPSPDPVDPADTALEVRQITNALPNTVVFSYRVPELPEANIQLQQDWDSTRRVPLDYRQNTVTSTYYYPGYYRAKLVINGQIVQETDVYLSGKDWTVAIEREPRPRYLLPEEISRAGSLRPDSALLKELDFNRPEWLQMAYVRDFGLPMNDFTLETAFRNTAASGGNACQDVRLAVLGTQGMMSFAFSAPGCTGDLRVFLGERRISGQTRDLSAFGAARGEWQRVRIAAKGNTIKVFKKDYLIFRDSLPGDMGRLAGVRFRFLGAGEVDYVRVGSRRQVVWQEEFE